MNQKTTIALFIIITLIGCSAKSKKINYNSIIDSFNPKKFNDFRNRSSFQVPVDNKVDIITIPIRQVPRRVLIEIKLPEADKILYVRMEEKERVNINRHMLQGQEYVFDPHSSALMILLDIPLIYLLDAQITFDFNILLFNSKKNTISKIKRSISFRWITNFINKNGKIRFHYGLTSKAQERINQYFKLKMQAQRELKKTNINRFKAAYRRKVLKFAY